jgi:hypothetical protein
MSEKPIFAVQHEPLGSAARLSRRFLPKLGPCASAAFSFSGIFSARDDRAVFLGNGRGQELVPAVRRMIPNAIRAVGAASAPFQRANLRRSRTVMRGSRKFVDLTALNAQV